jgi:hypothetical protein
MKIWTKTLSSKVYSPGRDLHPCIEKAQPVVVFISSSQKLNCQNIRKLHIYHICGGPRPVWNSGLLYTSVVKQLIKLTKTHC